MSAETSIPVRHATWMTTHWSMIARRDLPALAELYWWPVYMRIRRRSIGMNEAKDLVQEFFATFIEKDWIRQPDPSRGRFRAYLKTAVDHFLSDQRDRQHAIKRGGGRKTVSIHDEDFEMAERLVDSTAPPDEEFDRQFAWNLLHRAQEILDAEHAKRADYEEFRKNVQPFLDGQRGECPKPVALHRARARLGNILRDLVAQTVPPEQIDDELAFIIGAR